MAATQDPKASRFGKFEPWNRHLPYASSLRQEADESFEAIRVGFAEIVVRREFGPALRFWCNKLIQHISLYKFSFCLEDHVSLSKILLELLFIEDMDYTYQERIAVVLRRLLRKSDVLPSDALVVPWRPFYDLLSKLYFGKLRSTLDIHRQHSEAICKLVRVCRRFFAPESTKEILATMRPLLCPHDETCYRGAGFLAMFLPTDRESPAAAAPEFLCWVDEIIDMWHWIENMQDFDFCWVSLMLRVAALNVGHIDWDPLLPFLFTKILSSLQLPVGSESTPNTFGHSLPGNVGMLLPTRENKPTRIARMIVYMITPKNKTMQYLKKFLSDVEGYCHPSNTGSWSGALGIMIYKLTEQFARRLHEEKQDDCKTPKEARLREEDCQEFCTMLMPVIHLAMFGKSRHMTSAAAHGSRHLSYIAPDIALPQMMEKVYPALQTVTETHQTVSALSILLNIIRPLLWEEHYADGGKHIVPILQLCLPGIDPNDATKTQHALAVFMTVLANTQIMDCSESIPDNASENKRALYESTAFFEDWAMLFMDRVFCVLETLVPASGKIHSTERGLGYVLGVACEDLFEQLSPRVYETVVRKLYNWVVSNRMVHVGKTVGAICAGAVRANPEFTLKLFLPDICSRVSNLLEQFDTVDMEEETVEENVNEELLWFLHILLRLVKFGGASLPQYAEDIKKVLDRGLRLTAHKARKLAGKMLRHTLKSLLTLYMKESRSLPDSVIKAAKGDPIKIFDLRCTRTSPWEDLEVQWHVATQEEIDFAEELIERYYNPALEFVKNFCTGTATDTASRTRVLCNLMILRNFARVGLAVFPELERDQEDYNDESEVAMNAGKLVTDVENGIKVKGGPERRDELCKVMHDTIVYFLQHKEDDTKCLNTVIKILKQLMCVRGIPERKYSYSMRSYDMVKRQYEDIIGGDKKHTRGLLTSRIFLQHARRMNKLRVASPFHSRYKTLINDLVDLGCSRYAKVRLQAQTCLFSALAVFVEAKFNVIPAVINYLKVEPSELLEKHQQIKGALYILCHRSVAKCVNLHKPFLKMFVETITCLHSDEKPSVQSLVSRLFNTLRKEFRTRNFYNETPSVCLDMSVQFCPSVSDLAKQFHKESLEKAKDTCQKRMKEFDDLVSTLMNILSTGSIGWKFELMLAGIMISLLREDREIPQQVYQYFSRNLAHDLIHMRNQAVRSVSLMLAMNKTKVVKKMLVCGPGMKEPKLEDDSKDVKYLDINNWPVVGCREDNYAHCYKVNASDRPQSIADYKTVIYVDKNYLGWNGWPARTKGYVMGKDQPPLAPAPTNACFEELFEDEVFIPKWMAFSSQSKADGSASGFSDSRAELYKGLSRNHGMRFFEVFCKEVEMLLQEAPEDGAGERASKQRCAAEIIAGMVRGSKHWSAENQQVLWDWVIPVLQKVFPEVSNLNVADWASALRYCVYDRDPRRIYRLTDHLFEPGLTLTEDDTSFAQFRRLCFLHTALEELSWRGTEPANALLESLKEFVSHPYKIVREKIARCLFVVLRAFWKPRLSRDPTPDFSSHPVRKFIVEMAAVIEGARDTNDKDKKLEITNTCKTILLWVSTVFHDGSSDALIPHLHILLPVLFTLPETNPDDDDLAVLVAQALGYASQAMLPIDHDTSYVKSVLTAAISPSWKARKRALIFLQVFMFRNLYNVESEREMAVSAVVKLMSDEQLEVRELASVTLGGFVRCGLAPESLLSDFFEMAATPIRKQKRRRDSDGVSQAKPLSPEERQALVRRHAGVLGLKSFVSAFPYALKDWMPRVLMLMSERIHDPEPIKQCVKGSIGEFWRTHQDDRQAIRKVFSEDEYDILSEIVLGYNYYA
eukprot:m.41688 g.41688  ORF g.41688 m.41688 type:complete len:1837 (-) comp9800_c0_seq1:208-5718(-)